MSTYRTDEASNAWAGGSGGEAAEITAIASTSYHNYDGPLKSRSMRWWIIALNTIRANVNKSRLAFWVPVGIIVLTYLVRTVWFYFHQNIMTGLAAQGMTLPPDYDNPYAASIYNSMTLPFTSLIIFVAVLVVGASSIAADNRANALLVYLSKPITRFDYLFGKWMGIFLLLYALVAVPSLLMFLFFVCTYYSDGFLTNNALLLPKLLVGSAIPAVLHASLIVGFSAWSKSARVTGATYAAFYLILNSLALTIGNVLYFNDKTGVHIAESSMILHASVFGEEAGLAQHVYNVPPPTVTGRPMAGQRLTPRKPPKTPRKPPKWLPEKSPEMPPLWFVLLLGGAYIGLPLAAAAAKVRAVEVIRG